LISDEKAMKIYVSGPPTSSLKEAKDPHAMIYKVIAEILEENGVGYEVEFPIRNPELDMLGARDFFAEMSKKIDGAERVITVFQEGDQSTPVEATLAATKGKPQIVLELRDFQKTAGAPRLIRGLPGVIKAAS
jgi:hypothetical protein